MADRLTIDCTTGEEAAVPLTAEEHAERDAMAAQAEQDRQAEQVRTGNRSTIDQAITDALVRLSDLIAAPDVATVPDGTMTTAQLSNALRQMRTAVQQNRDGAQEVAQVLKRTIRLVRGDFDGID